MRGLSQRRLGEAVGLTKKAGSTRISRYEQGGSFATVPTLEALAAALDVPAAALLADTADLAEGILLLGSHADISRLVQALRALAKDDALLDKVLGQSVD